MGQPINSYAVFWGHYLRAHRRPGTRAVHYISTSIGLILLIPAPIMADWRLVLAALGVGYGLAWISHAAIEGNRPATFGHPIWSFVSDLRMLALFATGRLAPHLKRHLGGDTAAPSSQQQMYRP